MSAEEINCVGYFFPPPIKMSADANRLTYCKLGVSLVVLQANFFLLSANYKIPMKALRHRT